MTVIIHPKQKRSLDLDCSTGTSMQGLPNEIISTIFSKLEVSGIKYRFDCRGFRSAFCENVKVINCSDDTPNRCDNLGRLSVIAPSLDFRRLQKLHVQLNRKETSFSVQLGDLSGFSKLRKLELKGTDITNLDFNLCRLPRLAALSLSDNELDAHKICNVLKVFSCIRDLSILSGPLFKGDFSNFADCTFKYLTKLNFFYRSDTSEACKIKSADIGSLLRRAKKLELFNQDFPRFKIIGHDLGNLNNCLRSLRCINFDCEDQLMTSTIIKIANRASSLEMIDLGDKYVVDYALITLVNACSKLEHLDLRNCAELSNRSFTDIGSKLPHLNYLDVSGIDELTGEAFEHITKASNLTYLNIDGAKVTEQDLMDKLPRLQKLKELVMCESTNPVPPTLVRRMPSLETLKMSYDQCDDDIYSGVKEAISAAEELGRRILIY